MYSYEALEQQSFGVDLMRRRYIDGWRLVTPYSRIRDKFTLILTGISLFLYSSYSGSAVANAWKTRPTYRIRCMIVISHHNPSNEFRSWFSGKWGRCKGRTVRLYGHVSSKCVQGRHFRCVSLGLEKLGWENRFRGRVAYLYDYY